LSDTGHTPPRGGCHAAAPPIPNLSLKCRDFAVVVMSNVCCDLSFGWNQPLKLADVQYIGILKNKIKCLGNLFNYTK